MIIIKLLQKFSKKCQLEVLFSINSNNFFKKLSTFQKEFCWFLYKKIINIKFWVRYLIYYVYVVNYEKYYCFGGILLLQSKHTHWVLSFLGPVISLFSKRMTVTRQTVSSLIVGGGFLLNCCYSFFVQWLLFVCRGRHCEYTLWLWHLKQIV